MTRLVPEVDPKLVKAWERLIKLTRGSADVVEVLLPIAAGLTRDELVRLLGRAAGWREGSPLDAIEQLWKVLGVVPRYRHEELLRRYDVLRERVEEAEAGIRELRRTLSQQDRQAEARQSLDSWGALVRRTLAAQAELVRSVAGLASEPVVEVEEAPRALPGPEIEPGPAKRPAPARRPTGRGARKPVDPRPRP
jgi:hypothetical protein